MRPAARELDAVNPQTTPMRPTAKTIDDGPRTPLKTRPSSSTTASAITNAKKGPRLPIATRTTVLPVASPIHSQRRRRADRPKTTATMIPAPMTRLLPMLAPPSSSNRPKSCCATRSGARMTAAVITPARPSTPPNHHRCDRFE